MKFYKHIPGIFIGVLLTFSSIAYAATPVTQVINGGTGSTTLTGILKGNTKNPVGTVVIGSNLTFDGTTLSATGGGGSGNVATTSPGDTKGQLAAFGSTNGTPALIYGTATTTLIAGTNVSYSGGTPIILGSSPITINATGGGSGTVGSGTTGQFPYYAANGTTLTATSSLFIDPTGKIGIGTQSPTSLLDVFNSTGSTLNIRSNSGTSQFGIYVNAGFTEGTFFGHSSDHGYVYNVNSGKNLVNFYDSGNVLFNETGPLTGKIGIGTSTPYGFLSVNPTASIGTAPQFVIGSSTGTNLIVTSAGRVGIGNAAPATLLTLGASASTGSANGISFGVSGDNIYRPFAGALQSDANWNLPNLAASGGISTPFLSATNVALAIESFRGITTGGQVDTVSIGQSGSNTVTSGNLAQVDIYSNWNNSGGTATNTDFRIQRTETALSTGKQYLMQVGTSTAINLFNITNAGNVGIGTSSPYAPLAVSSTGTTLPYAIISGTQPLLQIGSSSPTYGYLANDRLNVLDSRNDYAAGNIYNLSAAACATADWTVANDLNATALNFGDFGHTSSGFTGVGCTNNPFTGFGANATYLFDPSGDVNMAAAVGNFKWFTGGYTPVKQAMTLTNTGRLGIGTTSPSATVAVNQASSSPTIPAQVWSYSTGTGNAATTTIGSIASTTGIASVNSGSTTIPFNGPGIASFQSYTSTASSTGLLLESISKGGCALLKDVQGTGYTQVYAQAGQLFGMVHTGSLSTCN